MLHTTNFLSTVLCARAQSHVYVPQANKQPWMWKGEGRPFYLDSTFQQQAREMNVLRTNNQAKKTQYGEKYIELNFKSVWKDAISFHYAISE